jgi:hypothetical protein
MVLFIKKNVLLKKKNPVHCTTLAVNGGQRWCARQSSGDFMAVDGGYVATDGGVPPLAGGGSTDGSFFFFFQIFYFLIRSFKVLPKK